MRTATTLLISTLAGVPALAATAPAGERPDIVSVSTDDAEMNAAAARARSELPDFFRRLAAPGPDESNFSVKFNLAGSGEMIWAGNLRRDEGRLTGTLSNVPEIAGYSYGQRVDIPEAAIVDWAYARDGRMMGHHTTRILLDRMPDDQAAQYRAALGW